jgi:L-cysteine:1D-myo-inositol 2-amino-2-deoxy-alpha-D-glucopyranoside ligase
MAKREGEPGWESVHGTGRPGWHIECTAIALRYLQPDKSDAYCIDIQGGGSDLIFPHHEMCASQAYVLTGKELAATYVHSAMIGLDGEKMSKSKGNLVFVSTLVRNGEDPMAIRLALLSQHYRQDRMWTSELFDEGKLRLLNLRKAFQLQEVAATSGVIEEICQALSHDLDTPRVFRTLDDWVERTLRGEKGGSNETLKTVLDALLGLAL